MMSVINIAHNVQGFQLLMLNLKQTFLLDSCMLSLIRITNADGQHSSAQLAQSQMLAAVILFNRGF
jgi:hypothetical protein